MQKLSCCALALAFASLAGTAPADVWDPVDDTVATWNEVSHGSVQVHDLAGTAALDQDDDWFMVNSLPGHSYEFRTDGQSRNFTLTTSRYAADGVTLLATTQTGGGYDVLSTTWVELTNTPGLQYIKVVGFQSNGVDNQHVYTARFYDTTISIPRYNNAAGQATVLLIQNTTERDVFGRYDMHTAAGAPVYGATFTIQPFAALVVNLATVGGGAANNTAGTVVIAHNGGYGGLAAKAVALDPATGFSFDTPGTYIPH
jgi:hypothetical protein